MRGRKLVVLALCLASCGRAAHAEAPIKVRPVAPVDARQPRKAPHVHPRAELAPEHRAGLEQRAQIWRSFEDDVTAPGFNRSPMASRRVGWKRELRRGDPRLEGLGTRPAGGPIEVLRVAILRIDFANDRTGSETSGNGRFDLTGPDTLAVPIDRPPHNRAFYLSHFEALERYYEAQSYGLIDIQGDVWPREQNAAYTLRDMADYGPWRYSQDIYPTARDLFRDSFIAADSQSIQRGDRIPWNSYDRFVLIHAGSDLQSDVRQDSPNDIPSFTIGVADSDMVVFPDSINRNRPIDRAALVPETIAQDGYFGAINGVLAHECGHLLFGFYDVYDVNSGIPVTGYWDLMDYGNGLGSIVQLASGEEIYATGFMPPSIDPWQRLRFMLLDVVPVPEVVFGDTVTLSRSDRDPSFRHVKLSSEEYLLLENRFLPPGELLEVDQDSVTRVVLGPKSPDPYAYDALLPGGGVVVWHVDESVPVLETSFPIDTAVRANPDFGLNSNPFRRGLEIIEADALDDLGDLGSPYLLGSPYDPYFRSNYNLLSDTSLPPLRLHTGALPHLSLEFLDDPDSLMRVVANQDWRMPGWPLLADYPSRGPVLLATDADGGDNQLEVCWAGGADSIFVLGSGWQPNPDVNALFALRKNGMGLEGPSPAFAWLDAKPRPVMAAISFEPVTPTPVSGFGGSGSWFAVSTYPTGPDTLSPGGRVWLIDGSEANRGQPISGWPASLPALVTTPPVVANGHVFVGCADGRVYGLDLGGQVLTVSTPALAGGIVGRLAVSPNGLIAAGGASGDVAVYDAQTAGFEAAAGWPKAVGDATFDPEFLWLDFGGSPNPQQDCFRGALTLVVHHADRLWAFCRNGEPLQGWGRDVGDTLVYGLGAGDPDGDGFPEVLTQSVGAQVAFWNTSGYPSPGWPKLASSEGLGAGFPPMAADLDGDGGSDVITVNGTGIIAAMRRDGTMVPGWPIAAGAVSAGAPLVIDLDRDGQVEVIVPDRYSQLYGYSVPSSGADAIAAWPMFGGDAGRTSSLRAGATSAPPDAAGPLVQGSLKAYPNPARRKPVTFAYQLTQPADVEFRILDTSGHEVTSFSRRGRVADNVEVWDPTGVPAGLYVARVRFRGDGAERVETVPIGILR